MKKLLVSCLAPIALVASMSASADQLNVKFTGTISENACGPVLTDPLTGKPSNTNTIYLGKYTPANATANGVFGNKVDFKIGFGDSKESSGTCNIAAVSTVDISVTGIAAASNGNVLQNIAATGPTNVGVLLQQGTTPILGSAPTRLSGAAARQAIPLNVQLFNLNNTQPVPGAVLTSAEFNVVYN